MDNETRFKGRRRQRHEARLTKGNAMLDHECSKPVQDLKGEYVKRKESARPVYMVGSYDRVAKRWELTDTEDANRCIYVKTGTILFAGFTY
jgi:hypothetical protein